MELLYKATDKCSFCIKMQYTVGKLHKYEGPIKICCSGFHACRKLAHVFEYYTRPAEIYVCEGNVVEEGDDKVVCDQIRLIRQVTVQELWAEGNKHQRVRRMIAMHPKATRKMLSALINDIDPDVRCAVALHPKATRKMLQALIEDNIWYVIRAAARHPKVTLKMLETLVNANDSEVRKAVASSPKVTLRMLKTLIKDRHWAVRICVAVNPKTTLKMLQTLASDNDLDVRNAVKERLEKLGKAIQSDQ